MARPRIPALPPGTPARLPAAHASAADFTSAIHGYHSGPAVSGPPAAREGAGPPSASATRHRRPVRVAGVPSAASAAEPQPGGEATMSASVGAALGWLLFRRIVDVPFETCLAALEAWPRAGEDGDLHIGGSLLRGPGEHDPGTGTCRLQVRLARGPLRPPCP